MNYDGSYTRVSARAGLECSCPLGEDLGGKFGDPAEELKILVRNVEKFSSFSAQGLGHTPQSNLLIYLIYIFLGCKGCTV